MKHTNPINRGFIRTATLALLICCGMSAQAQTSEANGYIIYYSGYYLTHDASTGAVVTDDVTDFDLSTCLWTINESSKYIRPVSSDGSTVLGNMYLCPRNGSNNFSLNTSPSTSYAAWTGGISEGGNPYYYYSSTRTYYLRHSGYYHWYVVNTNSANGTIYAVTKTTTEANIPEVYAGTLAGTTAFTATGSATYTPSATHTAAYSTTTVAYTYSGGTLGSTTTGTIPTPTAVNLSDGWTLTWSLSDAAYATIDQSGTLTVNSLPATYATTTVQLTATKDAITITATLPVTIYASADYYNNVAGGTQGISGGVVTLNDYEDHTWSYYSDASQPIHSLNPANVKITYYGNGTGNMTSSSETGKTPTSFSEDATGVQVNWDATANTFVYYKTLERENADGTGNLPYTPIPNPFQVRPTSSSGSNTYRGFYAWRVESLSSGLTITDGTNSYGVGDIVPADEEIQFVTSNEYGNEVEFVALWAQAYVASGSSTLTTYVPATVTSAYERNFQVLSTASSNITALSYPCTYTSIYPDGTDGTSTSLVTSITASRYGSFTAAADSKIENIILTDNNSTIAGNCYNFSIGRGVSGNGGNCASTFYTMGASTATISANTSYHARVESGTYGRTCFLTAATVTVSNPYVLNAHVTFGSDYDRAAGNDSRLSMAADAYLSLGGLGTTTPPYFGESNKRNRVLELVVKSGSYQENYWNHDAADASYSMYCGTTYQTTGATYYPGLRNITIEGGKFASINGGRGTTQSGYVDTSDIVYSLRIKGGTVNGSLYGAASANASYGGRRIILTGGTVRGWVAAGCNGTSSGAGNTLGTSYIYAGGNATVGDSDDPRTLNSTEGGNIFGAGRGSSSHGDSSNPASMTNSKIVIADNVLVTGNVYGGGNYGYIEENSYLFVLGGTVNGSVFGGANMNKLASEDAYITMTGGLVKSGLYGGSNSSGTVGGNVVIQVDGGQVGTSSSNANIHGGGYGADTRVSGNVSVTLGHNGQSTDGAVVYGDVYGGSALGYVNGTAANDTYSTNVTLYKGTINGSLYGGALGDAGTAANVYGPVTVAVYGGSVVKTGDDGSGSVYGCNNVNGAPQKTVTVNIDGSSAVVGYVYGGGNNAAYTYSTGNYPVVNVKAGTVTRDVFGGGKGASATVTGNPIVTLSGTAHVNGNVYGGGNAAPVIGATKVLLKN